MRGPTIFSLFAQRDFSFNTILENPSCVHHVECLKVRYWLCTSVCQSYKPGFCLISALVKLDT